MRFLKIFAVAAFVAMTGSPAQAGVYGSALLKTSNMVVQFSATENGVFTNIAGGFVTITRSTVDLVNTARLNGSMDQQFGSAIGSGLADAPQAFLTSGGEVAPAPNTFVRTVPVPANDAFSRADSLVNGSLINFGAPLNTGLETSVIAEIEAADNSFGSSVSSTGATAGFVFGGNQEGWYRLQFDGEADLLVSSTGPPSLRLATAETSLIVQINGADVSLDSPEAGLSFSISGNDSRSVSFTDLVTSSVLLQRDTLHTLTINHVARSGLAVVPEPATMLAFAGIFAVGGLNRLRRVRR